MASIEEERETLQGITFKRGRAYTPGELLSTLPTEEVKRDIVTLSVLFGSRATIGQVLIQFALALDKDVPHFEKMRAMDEQNMNLWSSLTKLNEIFGSNHKLSNVVE